MSYEHVFNIKVLYGTAHVFDNQLFLDECSTFIVNIYVKKILPKLFFQSDLHSARVIGSYTVFAF